MAVLPRSESLKTSREASMRLLPCVLPQPVSLDEKIQTWISPCVRGGVRLARRRMGAGRNLKPGLNFSTDINPLVNWLKADGSNRGGWEFIRLVNGIASDAF